MKKQKEYILRKAFICLMLGVYTFGLIKPIMPLVKDVVAHVFFESSHMATVHYENGRYHIHLELKEVAEKNNSAQSTAPSENESIFTHVKAEETNFVCFFQKTMEINTPYKINPIDLFQTPPFLPPKV
ncbi:MAG: hypothetical protein H7141_14000 [Burkholderiales bacterium]|nr:hypothetical protein [Bacteroidia bacterium]